MMNFDFNRSWTPVDLVKHGYIDAMKLFIKNEPHKRSKLDDNRQRLIFSVSLIDNIINSLLANAQNKNDIAHHLLSASQAGMSFTDEGISKFLNTIPEGAIAESDVPAWDFNVKPWEFDLELEARADLNGGRDTAWYHLLKVQYFCVLRKVFVLPDGRMYAQVIPGIMASGFNSTTATNSRIRALDHHLVAASLEFPPWCKTMGDDSLERYHPSLPDKYATLIGKPLKQLKKVSKQEGFEFCSKLFKDGVAYPVSEIKQTFNLLNYRPRNKRDLEERFEQYKYELRHHPRLNLLIKLVLASGWLGQVVAFPLGELSLDTKTDTVLTEMPRDCTVSSIAEWPFMNSPICLVESNTMTNKKNKNAKTVQPPKNKKSAKGNNPPKGSSTSSAGPMQTAGGILGSKIGGLLGSSSIGAGIGRWLGSGIGMITGTGDYEMIGPQPKYNVLSGQIPKFDSTRQTNVVCHREYLGDISGTTAFTNLQYALNPGLASTFPWLSQIAANYQQYKFHGVVFEFRSLITDFVTSGAPGVVVMSTNYNADQPSYTTKQEMENSEFAVSVKPTSNLMHMVECKPEQMAQKLYNIRTGSVPTGQDLRLYDLGLFQFATQSNPNQNLGELWVSYCVEFFKPILALEQGLAQANAAHVVRTGVAAATPLGTATTLSTGSLVYSITSTTMTITNVIIGTVYSFNAIFSATNTATNNVVPPTSITGGTQLTFNASPTGTDTNTYVSTTGTVSQSSSVNTYFKATSNSVVLSFPTTGTYGTGNPTLEIFVTVVDPGVTA
nr:MAG: putative RNA-dependent RNA polymerase [Barnaviridae sp.]